MPRLKFPQNLRVCVVPAADMVNVRRLEDGTLEPTGGLDYEFVKTLVEAMKVNVTYVISNPVSFGTRYENGSWDGALGLLQRNESDICVSGLIMREDRATDALCTTPYHFEEIRFAARLPLLASKKYVLIEPFLPSVWYTIVAVLFIMPLFFMLVNKKKFTYLEQLFSVFADLTDHSEDVDSDLTFRERILLAFWGMGARLLSFSYMSVLLSIMLIPSYETAIDTIDRLTYAVDRGIYECAVPKESVYLYFLLNSKDERLRRLANKMKENKWEYSIANVQSKAAINKYAAIMPLTYIKTLLDPRVLISKEILFSAPASIYARKGFCCMEQLENIVNHVVASGIRKLQNDHYQFFQKKIKNTNFAEEDTIKKLSLEHLSGAFIVLIIGISCSILVFAGEIVYSKCKIKKGINF